MTSNRNGHKPQDTNFSLFKYNNELSAEIEKLETQIAEYKEECASRMESVWCKKTEVSEVFVFFWVKHGETAKVYTVMKNILILGM